MNYIDATDAPDLRDGAIKIHGLDGFEGMRKAGQLSARCLDMIAPLVKPGVTTAEIDKAAMEFILDHGGVPACLGYRGYQHTVCTSVNHVVCHGIPNDKPMKDGDIVNIDVTAIVDGWHGDTSRMPSSPAQRQAISDTRFKHMRKQSAAPSSQTFADMASVSFSMIVRIFCIMDVRAKAKPCAKACSSQLSR